MGLCELLPRPHSLKVGGALLAQLLYLSPA